MDGQLLRARRMYDADPSNERAYLEYLKARARIEGDVVYRNEIADGTESLRKLIFKELERHGAHGATLVSSYLEHRGLSLRRLASKSMGAFGQCAESLCRILIRTIEEEEDAEVRENCYVALREIGSKAAPHLIRLLTSQKKIQRQLALEGLFRLGRFALPEILEMIKSPQRSRYLEGLTVARKVGVEAFKEEDGRSFRLPKLIQGYLLREEREVTRFGLDLLKQSKVDALQQILELFYDDRVLVWRNALRALGVSGQDSCSDWRIHLILNACFQDPRLRNSAALALGSILGAKVDPDLPKKSLDSPIVDIQVYQEVQQILTVLRDEGAIRGSEIIDGIPLCLEDRAIWNETSMMKQDAAIRFIEKTLSPAFSWLRTRTYTCDEEVHRIATFIHGKSELEFNLIPAGFFWLEASGEEEARKIRIEEPFLVSRCPVTQKQWERFSALQPSEFEGDDRPVENVSWEDCQEWLGEAGDGLRLLSEAEWEYACRAGCRGSYAFGESEKLMERFAFFVENTKRTQPIARKRPNAFGLHDVHGNVWEWCQDSWSDQVFADLPGDEDKKVSRGGAWNVGRRECQSSSRRAFAAGYRDSSIGFRVALSL